jgi:pyruvate kinase
MDVARLNFSHSTHSEHKKRIKLIRKVSGDLKKCVSIIADLQGPKIRIRRFLDGCVKIQKGQEFTITTDNIIGDDRRVSTGFPDLPNLLKKGSKMFLDDGELQMKVVEVTKKEVVCKVVIGGILKDNKGINLPGITSAISALTEKDKEDLAFAIENDVDFVAVSFVRNASDVLAVKNIILKSKKRIPVIAKLEKPEAIKNLDSIVNASDGVMVARGDLGIEMNPEKVPILQKNIIKKSNAAGRFVITATQMLDSMKTSPRPTRAEASDVANAIFDGTDAVMLSGETAAGEYPVKSVEMMTRIINEVENSKIWSDAFSLTDHEKTDSFSKTISHLAKHSAYELNAKAIVAFTMSGYTGKLISNVRPKTPVICFTPDERVIRELNIYWGLKPIKVGVIKSLESVIKKVEGELLTKKIAKVGDVVIIICGMPIIATGQTNLLKIHKMEGTNL